MKEYCNAMNSTGEHAPSADLGGITLNRHAGEPAEVCMRAGTHRDACRPVLPEISLVELAEAERVLGIPEYKRLLRL